MKLWQALLLWLGMWTTAIYIAVTVIAPYIKHVLEANGVKGL